MNARSAALVRGLPQRSLARAGVVAALLAGAPWIASASPGTTAASRPNENAPSRTTRATRPTSTAERRPATPAPFEATVTVSAEPLKVRIGDRIRILAHAASPPGASIARAPEVAIDGKLGSLRVLSIAPEGADLVLTLMPEETGELEIPPFEVEVRAASGAAGRASGQACRVEVLSVLGEGQGTTIADLKPPAEFPVPWPWKEILLGAIVAGLVTLAAAWIVKRLRRQRAPKPVPELELAPGVTPDAWAREELGKLLARRLVEAGRFREFHIELADLARRYIELRFRIPALERTTEEVREEMGRALVGQEATELGVLVLARCDRVKFAKYVPAPGDSEAVAARLRELIDLTAAVPVEAPPSLTAVEGAA